MTTVPPRNSLCSALGVSAYNLKTLSLTDGREFFWDWPSKRIDGHSYIHMFSRMNRVTAINSNIEPEHNWWISSQIELEISSTLDVCCNYQYVSNLCKTQILVRSNQKIIHGIRADSGSSSASNTHRHRRHIATQGETVSLDPIQTPNSSTQKT